MCGPLVMMLSAQSRVSRMSGVFPHLLYHGARIAVYAGLGALAGSVGLLLGVGSRLNYLTGVISLLLGLGIVLLGFSYVGWLPYGRLEGASPWLSRAMGGALRRGGVWGIVGLGALNGFLPCGLVYSGLLAAASRGQPLMSALAMVFFGAGTLPALLFLGIGAGTLSIQMRQAFSRVAGLLIVGIGCQLIMRGMAGLGVLPHVRLGGLVLW
jgi:sulfite exporter TauE/SafE